MDVPLHRVLLVILLGALVARPARAQHEGHGEMSMAPEDSVAAPRTLFQSDMRRMTGMVPLDPMGGMTMTGWSWMTTGVVRLGYNDQGGDRGDEAVESSNWLMLMAHRPLGRGRLTFMLMSSLERATFQDPGSPELFQTGETFDGKPLVDYQHPHDLFMNLSATYRATLSPRSALWFQLAPVGEPALGPTAFMHRASAGENPTAPLGHHWQDSSHITSNALTAGGGAGAWSIEASAFHGREPDEDRWDLDGGAIDSYSGRVAVEVVGGWSAQASFGDLHDPETLEPGDVKRTTASIHYGAAGDGPVAASLVWGRNDEEHGASNSVLFEYAQQFTRTDHVYGRIEWVEKDEQLLETRTLLDDPAGNAPLAGVTALTIGYFFDGGQPGLGLGAGAGVTFYLVPSSLDSAYGNAPVSYHVFARLRWMKATGGHAHHH